MNTSFFATRFARRRLPLGSFAGRLVGEKDKGRVIQKVVTEGSERAGSGDGGVFVDLKIKGASFTPQGEDDEVREREIYIYIYIYIRGDERSDGLRISQYEALC